MSHPKAERDRPEGPGGSANDRFKAQLGSHLQWSLVASVLLHAAIFLVWPWGDLPEPGGSSALGEFHLQVIGMGAADQGDRAGVLAPLFVEEGEDPSDEEAGEDSEAGADGESGADDPGLWDWELAGAAMQRMAQVTASVVPAELDREGDPDAPEGEFVEGATGEGDEAFHLRRATSELDFERLTGEEMLDLERLSVLRPELAFNTPSRWLLVQNPKEVGTFLQERFGASGSADSPQRSLSVSLWIDERGSVEWAEINRSSGNQRLDDSALELFRDVVAFRPAWEQGLRVPVAVIFWVPVW